MIEFFLENFLYINGKNLLLTMLKVANKFFQNLKISNMI